MSSPSNTAGEALPEGSVPKLTVLRGQRVGAAYPVKAGENVLGRSGDQPVDVNLDDQERSDQVWASPQHACIRFESGKLTIEDLKSERGTYVNRVRLPWSTQHPLKPEDVVQIGTVQLQVKVKVKKKTGAAK